MRSPPVTVAAARRAASASILLAGLTRAVAEGRRRAPSATTRLPLTQSLVVRGQAIVPSGNRSGRRSRCDRPRTCRGLFLDAHEQGAGQFAVSSEKRRIVGLVAMPENGRRTDIGVLFDKGFVGSAIVVGVCSQLRFAIVHQG